MQRTWLIVLALLLPLLTAGVYVSMPGHAPVGQPPLVEIDSRALSGMQSEFNRTAADVRVILLLSPT